MPAAANLVEVAALVGDTARATMLAALMGGQALGAIVLDAVTSPPSASSTIATSSCWPRLRMRERERRAGIGEGAVEIRLPKYGSGFL
jgi:hypothetical protein